VPGDPPSCGSNPGTGQDTRPVVYGPADLAFAGSRPAV